MRAIALLTLAATVAGCAAANTAGEVRGTVATVDWPNALVLLRDVRSTETRTPVAGRPAAGRATATVQGPPQQITVQVPPSTMPSTIVIEQQPARISVQQPHPRGELSERQAATERSARMRRPWCDGDYTPAAGTNFGKCAKAPEGTGGKPTQTE
jgi:hypothetical protein